jgi:large subunit ribosomal protein L15
VVVRRNKASRKKRGSRTYGWGAGKKHRGSGNRGGKGNAWCKHLWVWTLKYDPNHFGKHGFNQKLVEDAVAVNVGDIDQVLPQLLASGIVQKEGDAYIVDLLKATGAERLLGAGSVRNKMVVVHAKKWSAKAKEKIEAAGGSIAGDA